jgi:two-component system, NtrC family, sensor kinase
MRRLRSPAGFSTRRKLLAAFSALGLVFLGAFALQLEGLRRLEGHLAELEDHDEQARLALDLDDALRSRASNQAHLVLGEAGHLDAYRQDRTRAETLLAELRRRVDEPEAAAWVADIGEAAQALDLIFRDRIAPALQAGDLRGARAGHEASAALVQRMGADVDRIFAFLRVATARYHEEVHGLERLTRLFTLLFLVAVPLFSVGAALYLSRAVARPLAVLGAGTARVAAGDLTTRIELTTPDEFGVLAGEFNAMTAALREGQERLLRAEQLASIGRVAAGVAHELNDPLQVILGYVSHDRHRARGEAARHLAAVEREALRCKEIVQGLLQLSRSPMPVSLEPVDLRALAEEVAGALRVASPAAPELVVEGDGVALAARGRVRQIVLNLCRNAADAAGAQGRVLLSASASGASVVLAVSDTGPGVPPELRGRIFEPFFTTKPSGTGLGLPTARAIAHALGGELELGDPAGWGACFTLRLPRAPEGGAA